MKPSYSIIRRRACRSLLVTLVVSWLCFVSSATADVVSALNGEAGSLALITGFHSVTEPNGPFQLRVLEANGRATVAINPITLYFIVTNDSSAGDLQQHVWRLPVTVARVKSVTRIKSGVRIVTILDAVPDANVKPRELGLLVRYELENGILKDKITIQREGERPK